MFQWKSAKFSTIMQAYCLYLRVGCHKHCKLNTTDVLSPNICYRSSYEKSFDAVNFLTVYLIIIFYFPYHICLQIESVRIQCCRNKTIRFKFQHWIALSPSNLRNFSCGKHNVCSIYIHVAAVQKCLEFPS